MTENVPEKLGCASLASGSIGTAIVLINGHDGGNMRLFNLGLTALIISAIFLANSLIAKQTRALDDAFEHGIRVGHRKASRGIPRRLSLVRKDERSDETA